MTRNHQMLSRNILILFHQVQDADLATTFVHRDRRGSTIKSSERLLTSGERVKYRASLSYVIFLASRTSSYGFVLDAKRKTEVGDEGKRPGKCQGKSRVLILSGGIIRHLHCRQCTPGKYARREKETPLSQCYVVRGILRPVLHWVNESQMFLCFAFVADSGLGRFILVAARIRGSLRGCSPATHSAYGVLGGAFTAGSGVGVGRPSTNNQPTSLPHRRIYA
jgi:hypothetical protein